MPSIPDSVECPDCGQSFDPTTQGGWCTNSDCGSFRWEPDESRPDPGKGGSGGGGGGGGEVECPHCGDSVPDQQFCMSCGDPLDKKPEPPSDSTCPDCDSEVQEDWAACPSCGASLEEDPTPPEPPETPTCPSCGEEVEENWAACINCGTSLDDNNGPDSPPDNTSSGGDTAPDSVSLEVGGSEVMLEPGDVVGPKVRTAYKQAGGDEQQARYVSRDHALLEREGSDLYIVNKHRNGLEVNGQEVSVDSRERITDGDNITFAGVTTATVRIK